MTRGRYRKGNDMWFPALATASRVQRWPGRSAATAARAVTLGRLTAALGRLGAALKTSLFPFPGRTWGATSVGGWPPWYAEGVAHVSGRAGIVSPQPRASRDGLL